ARGARSSGLDGYIYVAQDIRGRLGSEGTFDMNRPPHSGHAGTDESTDTYDTIDWLVKNVPNNNGRVGVLGISYPGWLTAVAGIGAHPALKAISPQAPMGDAWMGDDFFHQGAFRLTYGLEYAWEMEASSDLSVTPSPERSDTAGLSHLVMGPWYHGQWFADSGVALGNVRFGRATGFDYRELQSKWFAYWLKGEGDGKFAEATVFDAGTSEWRSFDHWPPAEARRRHLYFREGGALSLEPPTAARAGGGGSDAADQYVSDPAHPIPYRPRPVARTYSRTSRWRRWATGDQR